MRLSAHELNVIRSEVLNADADGKIFLFGSRADDSRRGGDIDLFVETSYRLDLKRRMLLEHRISSACDTKVDMVFKSPSDAESPIHQIARRGVKL
jgi:predicted nucleotidyltransferase